MNKKEILEKSRKENIMGDEREKTIEQNANENAYIAIMGVYVLLGIIALTQKWVTGTSYAEPRIFFLVFFVGYAGRSITRYFYTKEKYNLIIFIFNVILAIENIIEIFFLS